MTTDGSLSSSGYWLYQKLSGERGIRLRGEGRVLYVEGGRGRLGVYATYPEEYMVTAEVIEKAVDCGAGVVAFSTTWGRATLEAKLRSDRLGVKLVPLGAVFKMVDRIR